MRSSFRSLIVTGSLLVSASYLAAQDTLPRLGEEIARLASSATARSEVARWAVRRAHTDRLFRIDSSAAWRYARLWGDGSPCVAQGDSLVPVPTHHEWPPGTSNSYMILADSAGQVLAAAEAPTSCSGDWSNTYTYYFDTNGRTAVFARYSGFFNGCAFGLAKEESVYYYDRTGTLIQKTYALTDGDGHPQSPAGCTFMYRHPYQIDASWISYARAVGLPARP